MLKRLSLVGIVTVAGLLLAATGGFAATVDCISCHKASNPALYMQWKDSGHGQNGVGCYDCHKAAPGDVDAFEHNGATIATLVTPKDCGGCHEAIEKETSNSYHAHAGEILQSKDAYLAHAAGGLPIVIVGCESCHGAKMIIDQNAPNKLSPLTWPNSGIGRLNPDGSKGACNACHTRHSFSKKQARQPENCGKCHLGPDHPQKEIYAESKHGIAYSGFKDKMALDSKEWVVGEDYYEAPTCATCHMSATSNQPITHDVGNRISWTLRPPVSKTKDNWKQKRQNMKDVCSSCHQENFVNGHYFQYDALVKLYNEKFAKPAGAIMTMVKDEKLMESPAAFSNQIEWEYWELWHHEGRRARMGAAMMGPDYAWWHGIYDVAHNFYFKFIPEARHYKNAKVNAYIDNLLATDPMHKWLSTNTGEIKKAIGSGEFQKIYMKLFDQSTTK
ncbi:multiheme c-type cytochrome [uncultured Desulfuromonas sp.]|uniref:multiheme c-type cytochrome n=2 Tax=Desulfuromonas TaxID=890 RepID=UPI0026201411|nr:multiheme c-type cytochrome [uncultured Desulfuromonas sp.]